MRKSHVNNSKRVTHELGGKSANIILDDVDIDLAIQQSQLGLFLNQGQCCIAGTRVYVQEGIYDEFMRRSVEAARSRIVGDPLASPRSRELRSMRGWFIHPTAFLDVTDDMVISREEIFGPSIDNAIKISNGIRTGTVYVNCYDVFDANTPFGGFKDSGIGRENGELSLCSYLEYKTVIMNARTT
ncbi:unnamed protein product [Peronospora farinosa]|nr:unnamed protein product [Peronospora farinosa]